MRYLLDTHTLIWWMTQTGDLPARVISILEDESTTVFASAVNAFEIATKHRIGKLPVAAELLANFSEDIASQGFLQQPISSEHALEAGRLILNHRDPFDRLLIAQAKVESLVLISNETLFDSAGITRIWE